MNQELKSKLKQYGIITSGILIAGTKVGKSQICYYNVDPDIVVGHGGITFIDLDRDNTNDLALEQYYYYYYIYSTELVKAVNHPSADLKAYNTTNFADKLDVGEKVSPSSGFALTSISYLGLDASTNYDWSNASPHANKYLGVRLDKGTYKLYGWIRLDYSGGSTGFTVKDMAVQMTPDSSINAGDVGVYYPDKNFAINENPVNGQVVGTAKAKDAGGAALVYSIKSGNSLGAFALNTTSGQLTVTDSIPIDFEVNTLFSLVLSATDGTYSDTSVVNITVKDVNEAPVIADQSFTIPENSPNGTVVDTVLATDPDNNISSFAITGGNTGNGFAIDNNGELTVNNVTALDFEINPVFNLVVEVSDGAINSSAAVVVNLTDDVLEGIEEINDLQFEVYPNPAKNGSEITLDLPGNELVKITISTLEGKTVKSLESTGNKVSLSTKGMSSGTYFIRVETSDNKSGINKVIIE